MISDRQKLGKWGEDQGSNYLINKGYEILQRNYRCRFGEIDIIAKKDDILIFVEVKTRKNTAYGYPAEAVNYKKRLRYEKLALYFLKETGQSNAACRFDILEILVHNKDKFFINHISNAFQADSGRYY